MHVKTLANDAGEFPVKEPVKRPQYGTYVDGARDGYVHADNDEQALDMLVTMTVQANSRRSAEQQISLQSLSVKRITDPDDLWRVR